MMNAKDDQIKRVEAEINAHQERFIRKFELLFNEHQKQQGKLEVETLKLKYDFD